MQHELQHRGAGLDKQPLEIIDVRIALPRLLGREPAIDHRNQHIFVVAAVEDHDLARPRHALVNAPQKIVGALLFGGRLPAHRSHAQRAGVAEHVAHRAVLAAGIGSLQHHQQLAVAVGQQQVLPFVDLQREALEVGLISGLVAA